MNLLAVPKETLVHSCSYSEYTGEFDRWNNQLYGPQTIVEYCRIDETPVYSRNKEQKTITADAVIFCYAEHTTPFLAFKEQSKIVYNNRERIITKVITNAHPFKDEVFSYELEVI